MKTVELNMTTEQLQELHLILGERIIRLQEELPSKNPTIQDIVRRQIDRTLPIYWQVSKMVIDHHAAA